MKQLVRIIISGEGGQGVQTIAKVLSTSAYMSGHKSLYVANYGVEQRGGVSLGFVQISGKEIGFPKFQCADILVILVDRAVERTLEYVKKNTLVIYDKDLVSEDSIKKVCSKTLGIEASKIAKEKMVAKVFDMIVLGALVNIVGDIDEKYVKEALHEILAHKYKKQPELKHFNEKAVEIGKKLVEEKVNA